MPLVEIAKEHDDALMQVGRHNTVEPQRSGSGEKARLEFRASAVGYRDVGLGAATRGAT
jgi:hypothetical protein